MTTDARIVAAARGWLGTRFHHQGRLKKSAAHAGGVDCLGLLVGVAKELDLRQSNGTPLIAFDETDYAHYPDTERLRAKLASIFQPVPIDAMHTGDVLLLNIDGNPQHLAIVTDTQGGYGMIHAYAPARAVVEHPIDAWWRRRIVRAFRFR